MVEREKARYEIRSFSYDTFSAYSDYFSRGKFSLLYTSCSQ